MSVEAILSAYGDTRTCTHVRTLTCTYSLTYAHMHITLRNDNKTKTFCFPWPNSWHYGGVALCVLRSLCVQELLDLAYSTLSEAASSSPQCAVQMFYTVRNVFELFCSVVPTYHAHSLANFPQFTGNRYSSTFQLLSSFSTPSLPNPLPHSKPPPQQCAVWPTSLNLQVIKQSLC